MTTTQRSDASQITSNASALLAGRLAVAAMGWAGTVLIVRSLSEGQWGRFTLVFSLLGMASVVTEMGLGRVAITGVTQEGVDPGRFAGSYVVLRACLGLLGYVSVLAVVILAGYDSETVTATAIAGLVVVIATPSVGYDLAFQAHLRMGWVALAAVFGQAAQLALTVAVVVAGGDVLWYFVPAVIAEVVVVLFKMRRAGRLISFEYCIEPSNWWRLIKEAVPLSIGGALVTLYTRVDTVMLSQLDTLEVVGLYGVAAKFSELARFAAIAVTLPILTVLVKSWPDDLTRFRSTLARGTALLLFCAGLALIEFGFFANDALGLLYGERFEIAGFATQLLILGTTVGFFSELAFFVLVSAGRNRMYPIAALVGLLLNVALNLYLIPRFSFEGAAWATVATNVVVLVLIWHQLLRLPGLRPLELGFLFRIIPVVAIAVLTTWAVAKVAPWPVAGFAAAASYSAAAVGLGLFGPGGLSGSKPEPHPVTRGTPDD